MGNLAGQVAGSIGRRIADKYKEERKWIADTLAEMPGEDRQKFDREYEARKKSVLTGYLFWMLFGSHYLYTKKPVKQFIFWITLGGVFCWYILDGFLMYFVVDSYNRKLSKEIITEVFESNSTQQSSQPDSQHMHI